MRIITNISPSTQYELMNMGEDWVSVCPFLDMFVVIGVSARWLMRTVCSAGSSTVSEDDSRHLRWPYGFLDGIECDTYRQIIRPIVESMLKPSEVLDGN